MNYWLMKSEPDAYSWAKLVKEGRGMWDGVRNYQARNNLRAMKEGDLAFFYHSNIGKEIVGIMKIIKESYQDPTTEDTAWVVVEVAPERELKRPVTLVEIKADPQLADIHLIRAARLSVQPITPSEFNRIMFLSEN
jgi:predicted RNA-binding protein with PUA-like domain